jgi:hypothetical protein
MSLQCGSGDAILQNATIFIRGTVQRHCIPLSEYGYETEQRSLRCYNHGAHELLFHYALFHVPTAHGALVIVMECKIVGF